jgi:hypothetical protein
MQPLMLRLMQLLKQPLMPPVNRPPSVYRSHVSGFIEQSPHTSNCRAAGFVAARRLMCSSTSEPLGKKV